MARQKCGFFGSEEWDDRPVYEAISWDLPGLRSGLRKKTKKQGKR